MRMKKSIKLLAKTTASSLIVTMTTGCGADEKSVADELTKKESADENSSRKKIDIKIKDSHGSVDTLRCIGSGRCVIQDN